MWKTLVSLKAKCYDGTNNTHLVNMSNFKGCRLPFEKPICKSDIVYNKKSVLYTLGPVAS